MKFFAKGIAQIIYLTFFLSACTSKVDSGIDFVITKDESFGNIKRSVEVTLPRRVNKKELELVANEIHSYGHDKTFIGYWIQGEPRSVYWATTHFTPDLNLTINGSTHEEHQKLISKPVAVDGDAIGSWLANWGYEHKIILYKENDKYLMKTQTLSDEVIEEITLKSQDGKRTIHKKGQEEYYIINKNNNLEFWSSNGNFYTAASL